MREVIALIGAGGKTTAMGLLARQSGKAGVFLTTTTHIFPMGSRCLQDPTGEQLVRALKAPGILCAGASAPQGKLGRLPRDVLALGLEAADLTVYEADGAHCLPLKLHRENEPVLLPETTRCLILAGLSALGQPLEQAVHRYDRNPDWAEAPQKPVGVAELVHCVLETAAASGLPRNALKVFLNQADTLPEPEPAIEAARLLNARGLDTRWGSLQAGPSGLYDWLK